MPPPVSTPWQMARYVRLTSRRSSAALSAVWLVSVRATSSKPLVSLSSRWTRPARGSTASSGYRCSSAFCSVPERLPAPGWTTSPTGLSMTSSASSAWTMASGIGSGSCSHGRFELGLELELLAALEQQARLGPAAPDRQLARIDPSAQPAPRELGQQGGRGLVQPPAGELGGHRQAPHDPAHRAASGAKETFGYTASSN